MAANYNCLLFDLDGTLLDFAAAENQAVLATLAQHELPADEETAALFSRINAALWAQLEKGEIKKDKLAVRRFSQLLEQLGLQGDAIRLNNDYLIRLSQTAIMVPGADELLEELAEFATIAAVSNGSYRVQMSRLEKTGLLRYFDEVFVSEKLGVNKPNAKFFDIALKRLGIQNRARTLVIGDSLSADVQGGINAGLATCWYNFFGLPNDTGVQPTYTVRSFAELRLVAVGEEEFARAALREKRHTV